MTVTAPHHSCETGHLLANNNSLGTRLPGLINTCTAKILQTVPCLMLWCLQLPSLELTHAGKRVTADSGSRTGMQPPARLVNRSNTRPEEQY